MATSQPHRVFLVNELLPELLRQVDDPKTLGHCARVNRKWNHISIPLLWRGSHMQSSPWRTPCVEFLAELAKSPEAFRYYIGLIDKLILLHGGQCPPSKFKVGSLFSPDIWSTFNGSMVLVDLGSGIMLEENMRPLINPRLRSLSLFGGSYKNTFLRALKDTCTLELFLMDDRADDLTWSALKDFVEQTPLRYLEWQQGFETLIDSELFSTMLECSTLKHLAIATQLSDYSFLDHHCCSSRIISLDITCPRPSLRNIFQHLPYLESFRAASSEGVLWDLASDVLRPIQVCRQLREFYIWTLRPLDIVMTADDLAGFADKCRLIHALDIEAYSLQDTDGTPVVLDAASIAATLAVWPALFEVTLRVPMTELTLPALRKISGNCPHLAFFSIAAATKTVSLDIDTVLFPYLLSFAVDELHVYTDVERVGEKSFLDDLKGQLRQCMPRLRSIEIARCFMQVLCHPTYEVSVHIDMRQSGRQVDYDDFPSVRRDIEYEISGR